MYLIGDIQGCDEALGRLLHTIDFSPSRDTIYLLGDLVNRGPDSLGTLRRLMALEGSAHCILGNHDLHLLAVSHGIRKPHRDDTLDDILQAPDAAALLDWLRCLPLALMPSVGQTPILLVHAGVLPAWTAGQTLALAAEVQAQLSGPQGWDFLAHMYGNQPDRWDDSLQGHDRLRVIVNALTRLRFCSADGQMEFAAKMGVDTAPPGYMPWFDVPERASRHERIAFGHWSTLGWLDRTDVFALDSGCVWGGSLSALRCESGAQGTLHTHLIQIGCAPQAIPG